jgi:type IV fimbrial biogenesis protein FimT
MQRQNGLSLIELMVVIALIGVIAGIGVPSFRQLILDNRLVSTTNQVLALLQQARSEAASRHSSVTICGSVNPNDASPTCEGETNWSNGIVMLQSQSGVDVLLKIVPATAAQEITVTSENDEIVFDSAGVTTAQTITITDSRSADDPEICRQIEINGIGQARSLTGDELVCN